MKVTRALLLSSKKQAESWEHSTTGILRWKRYRFLVEDRGRDLRLTISCVRQEAEEGTTRMCDIVAPTPHVEKTFANLGELHNFLHRYQIDFEYWQPVED